MKSLDREMGIIREIATVARGLRWREALIKE